MQEFQRFFFSFGPRSTSQLIRCKSNSKYDLIFLIFKAIDLCLLEFSLPPGDNYHGCGWLNCYYFGLKTQF